MVGRWSWFVGACGGWGRFGGGRCRHGDEIEVGRWIGVGEDEVVGGR